MKSKWIVALAITAGAMLGLSSCQNDRGTAPDVPNTDAKHTVTTEMFFLDEEGNLTSSLRAIDSAKGTITGDGSYFHNTSVTVTATAKAGYTLHKLYERNGKSNFTESAGVVNANSKTLNFKITDDMHFIAVFSSQSGSEKGYQNLKVNGTNGNYNLSAFSGEKQYTGSLTTVGEELGALKTATGVITGWTVTNSNYKAWELKTYNAPWLTAKANTDGTLSITAQPYISKTASARSVVLKLGKDGSISSAPSVWRDITITQNSYYDPNGEDPIIDGDITYGDGSVAGIPATLSTIYKPTGEKKDITTLHKTFKDKVYAKVYIYENGKKTNKFINKEVTVVFGAPSQAWLKKSSNNYSAGVNQTADTRKATIKVDFKLGNNIIRSTTVTAIQAPRKYVVGGEIQ